MTYINFAYFHQFLKIVNIIVNTIVPSYPQLHFLRFQLPAINCSPKILRYFERDREGERDHIYINFSTVYRDHIYITFSTVYCYNLSISLFIIVNLLLCLIDK